MFEKILERCQRLIALREYLRRTSATDKSFDTVTELLDRELDRLSKIERPVVNTEVREATGYLADLVGTLQSQVAYLEKDRDGLTKAVGDLASEALYHKRLIDALSERIALLGAP